MEPEAPLRESLDAVQQTLRRCAQQSCSLHPACSCLRRSSGGSRLPRLVDYCSGRASASSRHARLQCAHQTSGGTRSLSQPPCSRSRSPSVAVQLLDILSASVKTLHSCHRAQLVLDKRRRRRSPSSGECSMRLQRASGGRSVKTLCPHHRARLVLDKRRVKFLQSPRRPLSLGGRRDASAGRRRYALPHPRASSVLGERRTTRPPSSSGRSSRRRRASGRCALSCTSSWRRPRRGSSDIPPW